WAKHTRVVDKDVWDSKFGLDFIKCCGHADLVEDIHNNSIHLRRWIDLGDNLLRLRQRIRRASEYGDNFGVGPCERCSECLSGNR
ncbi:hypothetical protein COL922a_014163, partial [Colletotrichum nupharicola]